METEIAIMLKFRLKAPTVNGWANRLCAQWDLWMDRQGSAISVRFKGADSDVHDLDIQSYHNWRWLAQYIDFSVLDIQTLQYKNRTLAASFLYLTLLLKMNVYTAEDVVSRFRRESQCVLAHTPFNELFSRFLTDSFGFPLADILPTVQYCSGFMVLPARFEMPQLLRED